MSQTGESHEAWFKHVRAKLAGHQVAIGRLNKKAHQQLGSLGAGTEGQERKAFQVGLRVWVFSLPFLFVFAYGWHAAHRSGWTLWTGCYYAFVTLSTVGLGDYSIRNVTLPETFFILVGIAIISSTIGVVFDLLETEMKRATDDIRINLEREAERLATLTTHAAAETAAALPLSSVMAPTKDSEDPEIPQSSAFTNHEFFHHKPRAPSAVSKETDASPE